MAEPTVFKIEFEYINPTNIESEVPGEQEFREIDDAAMENDETSKELALQDSNLDEENKDEVKEYFFAPVITVTEQEASYTKGDLKLQKVSVTENISEPEINGTANTMNPDPQVQNDDHPASHDDKSDDDKPKTRIPMMKFRHAVDKVRADRRASVEKVEEIPTSRLSQKRSSIPILQLRPSRPESMTENQLNDEFDKLYHEIVDNEPNETLMENIEAKIKDPIKLEDTFEEIIHDYEENKMQPIHVDKKHTKIPLLKRKTEHMSKPTAKGPTKTPEKVNKPDTMLEKMETARINANISNTADNRKTNTKLPTMIREYKTFKQTSLPEKAKEIESNPKDESPTTKFESEIDKNDTLTEVDVQISIHVTEDVQLNQPLVEPIETATIDRVKVITSTDFERRIDDNNHHTVIRPQESLQTDYFKEKPEIVVINAIQDTVIIQQPETLEETYYKNQPKDNIYDEIVNEIKTTENPENVSDDIVTINNVLFNQIEIITDEPTLQTVNEMKVTSEEIITVEYSPDNVNDELLQNQATINATNNRMVETEDHDDNEYTPGKVSRLLRRIRSREFNAHEIEKDERKEPPVVIPKKKSVLTKVALFEANKPLETQKSKEPPKPTAKPIIRDSSCRKPVIVNELLKEEHKPKEHNTEENKAKEYAIEIVDESVKYHEVQYIKDLDQKELVIVTNDEENIPISIASSKFEPSPIIHMVQVIEPSKTDFLEPSTQNVEQKLPMGEVVIETLNYKPVQYEFKDEIAVDDIEVFTEKIENIISTNIENRQELEAERTVLVPETEILDFENQNELLVATNDAEKTPTFVPTNELKSNQIMNDVQVLVPIKTDYLYPPIQNEVYEIPINEARIENIIPTNIENRQELETERPTLVPETEMLDFENQNKLLIVTNDADKTPTIVTISELKPDQITNEVQILEPIKTDFLYPPIENEDYKIPITEVPIEMMPIKVIEYEFKDEILADDEVLYNDEDTNKKPTRFESRQEIKKDKTKSVTEMDLGNIVKGRVHQMIERMNSIEVLDVPRKEINTKERPRKKSVSKMIALFEISSCTQSTAVTRPETNKKLTINGPVLSDEEYQRLNKELINGRINYGRIENMTYLVLANGVEMPVIALGTALMNKQLIGNIIGAAIDMGYRAIDTAYIYGNEKEVGEAIRAKIEDGTVRREDLFISSKLWSTYHRTDLVPRACQNSLDAMGLEYFDLYMIHNPMSFKEGRDPIPKIANVIQYSEYDYLDAWYGMETLVSKGLTKNIGVSNFNSVQLQRILDRSKVKPVVNQVECHPYLCQQRLDEFCSERGVKLSCFGVLGSIGTPAELKSNLPPVFDDPLVRVMAAGLNISVAQLLIRYQIDSGHAVVVKASSAARLWDNLQALEVRLTQPQLDALSALNRNKRTFTFTGMGDTHRNYPFKIPF